MADPAYARLLAYYLAGEVRPLYRNEGEPFPPCVLRLDELPMLSRPGMYPNYWVLQRAVTFGADRTATLTHHACGPAFYLPQWVARTYALDPAFYHEFHCFWCKQWAPAEHYTVTLYGQ